MKPDEVHGNGHVKRWYLYRCRWFSVYFHRLNGSDPVPHLHNHTANSLSLLLWGKVAEQRQSKQLDLQRAPCLRFRRGETFHRLEVVSNFALTIFVIGGTPVREWGFLVNGEFKPHHEIETQADA